MLAVFYKATTDLEKEKADHPKQSSECGKVSFPIPNKKFNFRALCSAGTCRLSSVNVCERDAAVYCTGTVHSRGLLRKFGFLLSATNEKFLPDLSSLRTEAALEQ